MQPIALAGLQMHLNNIGTLSSFNSTTHCARHACIQDNVLQPIKIFDICLQLSKKSQIPAGEIQKACPCLYAHASSTLSTRKHLCLLKRQNGSSVNSDYILSTQAVHAPCTCCQHAACAIAAARNRIVLRSACDSVSRAPVQDDLGALTLILSQC